MYGRFWRKVENGEACKVAKTNINLKIAMCSAS
jgi:hypothetical protein